MPQEGHTPYQLQCLQAQNLHTKSVLLYYTCIFDYALLKKLSFYVF